MLEQAHIVRKLVCALRNGRKRRKDAAIQLARIGLPGDGIAACKAERVCYDAVHFVDLCSIPFKQLQKACLCARSATATQKTHGTKHGVELLKIEHEILHPEAGAFAHGYGLRVLVMRIARGRERLIPLCKGSEIL